MVGTPLEDAQRRDFTINALFYNLQTGKVEDYTGQGVDDLKKGLLRTPASATVTFNDDPLRALRAARFAARFNLKLHPDIIAAARTRNVKVSWITPLTCHRCEVGLY